MAKEPFSLKDVGTLKQGILAEEAGFKPLSNFGIDFTLRPETVFGALPLGDLTVLGQAIGKVQTEGAATNLLNSLSANTLDTGLGATMKRAGTGSSATNAVINEIKQFKANDPFSTEPNITRDDIQNYIASKRPDLDLAPIQTPRFTKSELDELNDRTGGFTQQYITQPFKSRGFAEQMASRAPSADGLSFYDLEEQGRFKEAQDMYDANLKSVSDFAEDKITQSNITNLVDETTGKSLYDPDFARAVTLENQGESADAEGTFICTVLYEMNILPINIYKYDQRYGQQVNRKIYNGYAIWGKPIAERMRKEGLTFKIIKPIACAWAEQMAFDLSEGKVGKNRFSIKIGKFIGEAICYSIGLFIKPKGEKNGTPSRSRQHGEKRRVVYGKDGLPKRRGRPRTNR